MVNILYRYDTDTRPIYGHDWNGEFSFSGFYNYKLVLKEYKIIAETEKGYWITITGFDKKEKWVSKTSRKRFAYPTKEEAIDSFIKRKEKQVKLLSFQLREIKGYLKDAEFEKKSIMQSL